MIPTETAFSDLLAAADVPGIALAVVRQGRLDRVSCFGFRDVRAPGAIDEDTVLMPLR